MKKLIFLITLHASLFTLHVTEAQIINVPADQPTITTSVFFGISEPIRDMPVVLPGVRNDEQKIFRNRFPKWPGDPGTGEDRTERPVIQNEKGSLKSRGPLLNFEGVGNESGGYPADPNGEPGLEHYVQTVNSSYAVWDKSGNLLYGPVDYQTIWASFPGPWDTYIWCDPIIKYDHMADRWVIITMSFDFTDFYTMTAVSTTPDPLGSYYCYAYFFPEMNDYPKISIWPDGYYMTYNFWDYNSDAFLYSLAIVMDRDAMLAGDASADMIQFQVPNSDNANFFPLPADCRGTLLPNESACYIATLGSHDTNNFWNFSFDIYAFSTDWEVPSNSSLDWIASFDIGEFEPLTVFGPGAPQMGSDITVMTIPVYLMYPLTYRMFDTHEVMTACHAVWDGETHYIKWYEFRKEGAGWYIYQTGNYAPGDDHYFMGSISINGNGDIALGYSISNTDMYPSIHYTGRHAEDSLGIMTLEEMQLYKGLNYANNYQADYGQNRWGDYSSMMVDPSDDSTFWYTNMYPTASTMPGNWSTRIFSLDLSEEQVMPVADAGNDSLTYNIVFFETQGQAENYSSVWWTSSGDGNFISNYSENVTYLRGPGDLDSGQVTLTMHLTGYYPGTEAADSMVLYLLPVAIEEVSVANFNIDIFPNPATDIITVRAHLPSDAPVVLKIISESGKEIFTSRYSPVNRRIERQFDFSYLPDGIYFLRLTAGEKTTTQKLIIKN